MATENKHQSIKSSLLGTFEIALLMPQGAKRFSTERDAAIRSFFIPALLFPISLLALYHTSPGTSGDDLTNTIIMLYAVRLFVFWLLFFGIVRWILNEVGRGEHFYQFVSANNWLSIPATAIFIPIVWMIAAGTHSFNELYPFILCLMGYTYLFTAYMSVHVLRVPLEFAGFLVFIAFMIDRSTTDIFTWVGATL